MRGATIASTDTSARIRASASICRRVSANLAEVQ